MAQVILFHSIRGLRPVELAAADHMRAAGHTVTTPDLFEGRTVATVDAGFALVEAIGWPTLVARAVEAAAGLPETAVLGGLSMGAGIAAELWALRPATRGLLLHGVGPVPKAPRPGVPVQVHMAEPDPFDDEAFLADWAAEARAAGVALDFFRYPGVGHLFIDASLPDYDAAAAALSWQRSLSFLAGF